MTDSPVTTISQMANEIAQLPQAVARFLDQSDDALVQTATALRARDPALITTVARGSSSHAATYLKYAIELQTGLPVAMLSPSIASIYQRPLRLTKAVSIAISQSGRSSDVVCMVDAAREGGALTVAITNDVDSPVANGSAHCLALLAGEEKSVAATKTFVNSVVAGLMLLAEWQQDRVLRRALDELPEAFSRAIALDWSPLATCLSTNSHAFMLGRGPGIGIAAEAALKLEEACGIHAGAYSSAEVLHGPAAIVQTGFPILALGGNDASLSRLQDTAKTLARQGGAVFVTGGNVPGTTFLPSVSGLHPLLDPLVQIGSFYAMAESLSRRCGFNPDTPPHLRKITKTL